MKIMAGPMLAASVTLARSPRAAPAYIAVPVAQAPLWWLHHDLVFPWKFATAKCARASWLTSRAHCRIDGALIGGHPTMRMEVA